VWAIERVSDVIGSKVMLVVRFVSQPGVPDWTLGIPARTKVTVWRELERAPTTQVQKRERTVRAMPTLMGREEAQGITLDEAWLEGRQDDGDQDSGGKHGGGGDDTNDNKDDGHFRPATRSRQRQHGY
jgi:hypothetical protein